VISLVELPGHVRNFRFPLAITGSFSSGPDDDHIRSGLDIALQININVIGVSDGAIPTAAYPKS
jgi:hypothetical protein